MPHETAPSYGLNVVHDLFSIVHYLLENNTEDTKPTCVPAKRFQALSSL